MGNSLESVTIKTMVYCQNHGSRDSFTIDPEQRAKELVKSITCDNVWVYIVQLNGVKIRVPIANVADAVDSPEAETEKIVTRPVVPAYIPQLPTPADGVPVTTTVEASFDSEGRMVDYQQSAEKHPVAKRRGRPKGSRNKIEASGG